MIKHNFLCIFSGYVNLQKYEGLSLKQILESHGQYLLKDCQLKGRL